MAFIAESKSRGDTTSLHTLESRTRFERESLTYTFIMVLLELAVAVAFVGSLIGVETRYIAKRFFGKHHVEKYDDHYVAPGGYYYTTAFTD